MLLLLCSRRFFKALKPNNFVPPQRLALKVLEVKDETPSVKSIKLSLGDKEFPYMPGQNVLVNLANDSKSFSLTTSPTDKGYIRLATRMTGSDFKKAWASLKPGDEVTIFGPLGKFTLDETAQHIVLIAGGIGITPFEGMIRYATEKQLPFKITLLYSNNLPEDIPFKQELEELSNRNKNLEVIHTITKLEESKIEWKGRVGRIDETLVKEKAGSDCLIYICGPPGLVEAIKGLCTACGMDPAKVRMESFEGY
ncbi:MAG: FAD-dependent oxidoreductase [Planctomycetes bacterium]|nr:FAD-dependent oxidoreductase [Planctomycetota bacterium]